MAIRFQGFYTEEGSTQVLKFWGDIHDLTFRADKAIKTLADLKEVTERFEKDRSQFDWTSYASHTKFNKASREYFTLYEGHKFLHEITFEFEGKVYRTKTAKWSVISAVEKKADKILKHVEIQTKSLMRDDTDEVIEVLEEMWRVNHLLDDLSDANDPNSYIC